MVAQLKGYVRRSNDAGVVGLLGEAGAHTSTGGRECEEKGAQRPENHGHLAPTPRQWLNRATVHVGHLRLAYAHIGQRRRPKPPPLMLSSSTRPPYSVDAREGQREVTRGDLSRRPSHLR